MANTKARPVFRVEPPTSAAFDPYFGAPEPSPKALRRKSSLLRFEPPTNYFDVPKPSPKANRRWATPRVSKPTSKRTVKTQKLKFRVESPPRGSPKAVRRPTKRQLYFEPPVREPPPAIVSQNAPAPPELKLKRSTAGGLVYQTLPKGARLWKAFAGAYSPNLCKPCWFALEEDDALSYCHKKRQTVGVFETVKPLKLLDVSEPKTIHTLKENARFQHDIQTGRVSATDFKHWAEDADAAMLALYGGQLRDSSKPSLWEDTFRVKGDRVTRSSSYGNDLIIARAVCSLLGADGWIFQKRGGVFHGEAMLCDPQNGLNLIETMPCSEANAAYWRRYQAKLK